MNKPVQFGRRSTADQVLAGIDLTGKRIVVTGCNSGLGLATMNAFAANGATVIDWQEQPRPRPTRALRQVPSAFPSSAISRT